MSPALAGGRLGRTLWEGGASASPGSVLGQAPWLGCLRGRGDRWQVGRLCCIKGTATSLGREELLNSGMGLAVYSQLGLCEMVPECFGLHSDVL